MDIRDPYQSDYGAEWDAITMDSFLKNQLWTTGTVNKLSSMHLISQERELLIKDFRPFWVPNLRGQSFYLVVK